MYYDNLLAENRFLDILIIFQLVYWNNGKVTGLAGKGAFRGELAIARGPAIL